MQSDRVRVLPFGSAGQAQPKHAGLLRQRTCDLTHNSDDTTEPRLYRTKGPQREGEALRKRYPRHLTILLVRFAESPIAWLEPGGSSLALVLRGPDVNFRRLR